MGTMIGAVLLAGVLGLAAPTRAEDPLFIPWSAQLEGFNSGYEPTSAYGPLDFVAGRRAARDAYCAAQG